MHKPEPLIIFTGSSSRGWHRLQQGAECLQKYAWSYGTGTEDGVKEKEGPGSPALAKGSLMHLALAQHYARMMEEQNGRDPELYEHPKEAVPFIAKVIGGEEFVPLVLEVFEAYCDHYPLDEKNLKIFGVEKLYEHTIRGKYLFTGRIDLLWHDAGGRLWAADHKCLPASTRVLTPKGVMTVGALFEAKRPWTCLAYDEDKKSFSWSEAHAPERAGMMNVNRLYFIDGSNEEYGYNHPILTKSGWKKACFIQTDELVARGLPANGELPKAVQWVRVTGNLTLPAVWCYDIEVPKFHTFVTGNGIVTHNTTSRLTPSHKQYYSASGQLIGYQYLARQHHPETVGLKLNLIEVSKTPKFERISLPSAPHFEAQFEQTVEDIEESIIRMQESGRPIHLWPKAMNELTCFHRYGACEFLDRCRWGHTSKGDPKWTWKD